MGAVNFISDESGEVILQLSGKWSLLSAKDLQEEIRTLPLPRQKTIRVRWNHITGADVTGSWVLHSLLQHLSHRGNHLVLPLDQGPMYQLLQLVDTYASKEKSPQTSPHYSLTDMLFHLGKRFVTYKENISKATNFLGFVIHNLIQTFRRAQPFSWTSLAYHLEQVGLRAMPIVGLLGVLIGVVLVYQSVDQLRRFGAEVFTVDLLGISVTREIGVLITSILVAGRSGSAFAAQIGLMRLNQEIDALDVMGLRPVATLVIPRVLALIISLPLLTLFANFVALGGGAAMCGIILDMPFSAFMHQLNLSLDIKHLWVGLIKAPFFALAIGLIGCFEGFQVQRGAEDLGRHTTKAVVESIFLVICLDALFSVFFSKIGM